MDVRRTLVWLVALLAIAAATAAPERDSRAFDGSGSLGTDSPIELYLLEETYHHRIVAINGCFITASLFPMRGKPGVPLSDVLQASDLSAGERAAGAPEADPAGSFTVTGAGWVNLQVGTGTDCRWSYSITGLFLPEGEEPAPPSPWNQLWLVIAAVVAVIAVSVLAARRKPSPPQLEEEPAIRVLEA